MKIEDTEKMRKDVANVIKPTFCYTENLAKIVTADGFTLFNPIGISTGCNETTYIALEVAYDGSIFIWDLHRTNTGDRLRGIVDPKDYQNKMIMIANLVQDIMLIARWDGVDLY